MLADETPARLSAGLKSVLHVMPLISFSPEFQITLLKIREKKVFDPLRVLGGGDRFRFNFDGFVIELGDLGYCQYFRNGIIEIALSWEGHRNRFPISFIRADTIKSLPKCFDALQDLTIPAPIVVQLSLLGVKESSRMQFPDTSRIHQDVLILPDVIIEEFGCDVPKALKPMFDALWNSVGEESSP